MGFHSPLNKAGYFLGGSFGGGGTLHSHAGTVDGRKSWMPPWDGAKTPRKSWDFNYQPTSTGAEIQPSTVLCCTIYSIELV